jgi:serine/threonine-protein phosphatase 2B regulatory subunit
VDSDLLSIPEFAMNPLASRMVALMDKESDRTINFRSFAVFLSHFGKHKRNSDARFAFLFRLYDCDDDGKVSVDDLRKVIKMQVGDWCSAEQVDAVVQKTMAAADVDKDGALNYNDFVKAITKVGGLADVLNFRLGEDPFDDGGGDALESADIF